MNFQILKYYQEKKDNLDNLEIEFDETGDRPSWIHIINPDLKARFVSIRTVKESEIIYKRFTGNFYYPIDFIRSKEEESKFYQKYAQYYDQNTAKNNVPMAEFILQKIIDLKLPINSKILDLGAGTGLFSQLAINAGYKDLTLVDISQPMLTVAQNKPELENCQFICSDVIKLSLSNKFDIAVSIMMFDALTQSEAEMTLNIIKQNLKPNSYIFIIQDKVNGIYQKYFKIIEENNFTISPEKNFAKYYYIMQNIQ